MCPNFNIVSKVKLSCTWLDMGLGNPYGVRHLLQTFLGWSQKNVWGRYSTWDYIEIKYFKRLYVFKLNSSDGCNYKFTNLLGFL